ncbi:MAG: hypothetical protein O6952_01325 [Planctomycetota bacterium]|nr:hypothetical protein [Planctomycetota bacterium]
MAPRYAAPTAESPWEPRNRSTREGQSPEISIPTDSGRDTSEIIESIADEILYRIQRERMIMEERGGLE